MKELYDLKKPHELIAILKTKDGDVVILSNVFESSQKLWMLEHAKFMVLGGDEA